MVGANGARVASGVAQVCVSHLVDHRHFHAFDGSGFVQNSQSTIAIASWCDVGPHDRVELFCIAVFAIGRNGGSAIFSAHIDRAHFRCVVA